MVNITNSSNGVVNSNIELTYMSALDINTLRMRQMGSLFVDYILELIFFYEFFSFLFQISPWFIPKGFKWQLVNIGSDNGFVEKHVLLIC